MKYFTKEWYETCQNSNWHLNMSVSKNAEEFSEDYYKDLYTRRRRAFVKEQKEVAEVLGEEFSKVIAEVEFMNRHEETVKAMEANLPLEIKAEVADMRVLALDIATKEVRQQLKAWCEANKKEADAKIAAYDGLALEENLHDSVIRTMEMKAETLTFKLDCSDVKKVVFKNYKILEQGGYVLGATWLNQEVYEAEGGREYHALLMKKDGKLAEMTVFAEEIEFIR
ncbi:MAG: DUF4085 family protein [Anaerotignum sp.]|nr:DUF4085 family protein [Anaerotignum sp.]